MSETATASVMKFDRKTFDPTNNQEHRNILTQLRQVGSGRMFRFKNQAERYRLQHVSSALRYLALPKIETQRIYLDLGCGDSPDVLIAAMLGYEGYGLDLFPPNEDYEGGAKFIQADVVDNIPFGEGLVCAITSQAMIDLVEPDKRLDFYKEVYRVLEPGGAFSQTGAHLANGHGFTNRDEVERVRRAGFRAVWGQPNGFLAVK